MANSAPDDGLLVEVGLTEKEYLAALKRIEANTIRGAKKNEQAFKVANKNIAGSFKQADTAASGFARGGLRQVSMQFSQVAQQGAVTGNYLQALAIQAPDLALGFGAIGITAGALIPILFGVAQAAMGAEEEIKDIDIQAEYGAVKGAIEAAREAQDRYSNAIRLSGAAQSEITPEILGNLRLEAEAREALAAFEMEKFRQQKKVLEAELAERRAALEAEVDAAVEQAKRIQEVRNEAMGQPLDDPGSEAAYTAQERELVAVVEQVLELRQDEVDAIRLQAAELDLVNSQMDQTTGKTSELVDGLIDASEASGGIATSVGQIDFSSALQGAVNLSNELGISLHKAMQIKSLVGAAAQAAQDAARGPILDPRDPNYDPIKAEMARIQAEGYGTTSPFDSNRMAREARELAKSNRGRSGGGGSKKKSDAEREAEKETNRLLSERDRILRSLETPYQEYERKLSDINKLHEMGKLTAAQYNAAVADIDADLLQAEYGAIIDGIESVSDAMANAIVNGESMGEALGQVFRKIAQDLIASGIQNMLMQLFSGAVGGGGSGGFGAIIAGAFGGARGAGGPVMAGRGYMVGENGPEPFIPAVNGRILSTAQAQQALASGQSGARAPGGVADVRVYVDQNGNWQAAVERISARQAGAASRAMARGIDRGFPDRLQQLQRRNT